MTRVLDGPGGAFPVTLSTPSPGVPAGWSTVTSGAGTVTPNSPTQFTTAAPSSADAACIISPFLAWFDLSTTVKQSGSSATCMVAQVTGSYQASLAPTATVGQIFAVTDQGNGTVIVYKRVPGPSDVSMGTVTVGTTNPYTVRILRQLGLWTIQITPQGGSPTTFTADPETLDQTNMWGPIQVILGDSQTGYGAGTVTFTNTTLADAATPMVDMRVPDTITHTITHTSVAKRSYLATTIDRARHFWVAPSGALPHWSYTGGNAVYFGFGQFSYEVCWDIDLFLQLGLKATCRGLYLNFEANPDTDGCFPMTVASTGIVQPTVGRLFSQPYYAAIAYQCSLDGDCSWFDYTKLKAHIAGLEGRRLSGNGVFYITEGSESGWDGFIAPNPAETDPSPGPNVFESVLTSCLMVREYDAMTAIATNLGHSSDATTYSGKASALRTAIQARLWDASAQWFKDRDTTGTYYVGNGGVSTHYQADNVFALWCGVATSGQALAIRNRLMDSSHFLSTAGLTSLDKTDAAYQPTGVSSPTSKQTNWNGPLWYPVQWMAAFGLTRYGYTADAAIVASRIVTTWDANVSSAVAVGGPGEWNNPTTGAADPAAHNPYMGFYAMTGLLCERFLAAGFDPGHIDPSTVSRTLPDLSV